MNTEINYSGAEATQDPMAQQILNNITSGKSEFEEADEDINLPSNGSETEDNYSDEDSEEVKLFANKYKSVDELKKGIKHIGSDLDDDILNGMSDEALEKYYNKLNFEKSKGSEKTEKKFAIDDNQEDKQDKDNKPKETEKPVGSISQELWNDLENTFNERGGITSAQYEKLEKMGIPSDIVDNYIDGINAKNQTRANMIVEIAGGEQELNEIRQWAENGGIDKDYIDSLNYMNDSQLKTALKLIKTQYEVVNGKKNLNRVVGSGVKQSSSGYKSMQEYMLDVNDKRYSYDENFRSLVDRKLARSKFN